MTEEEFKQIKQDYLELVTKVIVETGSFNPSFTVLGIHKPDNKNAIGIIPMDPEYMVDEATKDEFINYVLPEIAKKVRERIDIHAIGWASEAWMRVSDNKDIDKTMDNWKDIPIKAEILIITLDSENFKETFIKEIIRKGKQVNEDGDLVDQIELIDMPGYENLPATGRFTDLYEKFTKNI